MDPAVYNAIKAEEAKLEAEKDGLKKQKEVLEDEVDTLQSEKDALSIEIETLNREKKQAETAVKGLQTMCRGMSAFFIICIRASCSFLQISPSFFSQKIINIADYRFVLPIVCNYFYTFVVRIWQICKRKVFC